MSYCTLSDIQNTRIPEETLVQLTDDAGVGVVDQDVVTEAIAEADDLIDGYLRGRYQLPLTSVPKVLSGISASIAAFKLYGRRPEFDTPELVIKAHDAALKTLDQIRKGAVRLGLPDLDGVEETGDKPDVSAPARVFDDDSLENF